MLFRTQLSVESNTSTGSDSDSPLSSRKNAANTKNHHHNPRNYHKKGILGVRETSEYLIARRRAAEVAIVSVESKTRKARDDDKFSETYRDFTFQEAELKSIQQKSQLELHKQLLKMDTKFKLELVFHIIDLDKTKGVSALELAKILQLIQGANSSFHEAFKAAQLTLAANDSDGDDKLCFKDFCTFIDSMASFLEKSSDDVAHFLIIEVTSHYDGNFIINEIMEHSTLLQESRSGQLMTKASSHHRSKMNPFEEARMLLVFELLDSMTQGGTHGLVEFRSVVHAMTPLIKGMDQQFVKLLFAINDGDQELSQRKKFDFPQFLEFVTKVNIASSADVSMDEIANILTIHLSSTTVSGHAEFMSIDFTAMKQQNARQSQRSVSDAATSSSAQPSFANLRGTVPKTRRRSLDSNDHGNGSSDTNGGPKVTLKDQQRIERLFNIWDSNHDRELEVMDLFMGLRKFHQVKQLGDEALSPTMSSMKQNELNKVDQFITMEEFESIILKYAKEVNVPVYEMIDFMYIQTLMMDSDKDISAVNNKNKNDNDNDNDNDKSERPVPAKAVSHRNILQEMSFDDSNNGGCDKKIDYSDSDNNTINPLARQQRSTSDPRMPSIKALPRQQRSKSDQRMPSWGNLWNVTSGLAEELSNSNHHHQQELKRSLYVNSSSRCRTNLYEVKKRDYRKGTNVTPTATRRNKPIRKNTTDADRSPSPPPSTTTAATAGKTATAGNTAAAGKTTSSSASAIASRPSRQKPRRATMAF